MDGHLSFGLYYVETGESILCWVGRWVSCWWGLGGACRFKWSLLRIAWSFWFLGTATAALLSQSWWVAWSENWAQKNGKKKKKKGVECQQQHTPSKLHCGDFSMDCRRNWQQCLTLLLLVAGHRMHIPPGVMWLLSWQLRKRQSIKHLSKRQNWLNAVVWALASWRVRG